MQDIRLRCGRMNISLVAMYTVLVSVCYILPVIKYSVPYVLLGSALLLTYVLAIMGQTIDQKVVLPSICCALGLMLMMSLIAKPGDLTEGINELIRALRLVAPGILFLMLQRSRTSNRREMAIIFLVITGLLLFICYRTIIELNKNSLIARILAGGLGLDDEFKRLRFQNIAGFEATYASGFLGVFCLFLFLESKKKLLSLLSLMAFLFFGYYVIRAQYMTLLLLMVAGCMALLILRTKGLNRTLVLVGCAFAVLAVPALVEALGGGAEENTGMLMEKFDQFEAVEGVGIDALGRRPSLYLQSFLRFLHSPLWGNSITKNGVHLSGYVSSHSSLFGYLQSMGLIGAFLFYYPIVCLMKECYKQVCDLSQHSGTFWKCCCTLYIVLSILNPVDYCFEISFVMFLCIPCGMKIFLGKN